MKKFSNIAAAIMTSALIALSAPASAQEVSCPGFAASNRGLEVSGNTLLADQQYAQYATAGQLAQAIATGVIQRRGDLLAAAPEECRGVDTIATAILAASNLTADTPRENLRDRSILVPTYMTPQPVAAAPQSAPQTVSEPVVQGGAVVAERQAELSEAQRERGELEARLRAEQSRGSQANPAVITQLAQQITGTNGRITRLTRELRVLAGRVDALDTRMTAAEAGIAANTANFSNFYTKAETDALLAGLRPAAPAAGANEAGNEAQAGEQSASDPVLAWLESWWKTIAAFIAAIVVGYFFIFKVILPLTRKQEDYDDEEEQQPTADGRQNVRPFMRTSDLPADSLDEMGDDADMSFAGQR